MTDKIEVALRDFVSSLQTGRLYPQWHPQFKRSIDKVYLSLQEVLDEKDHFVVGIVGEELAFEKEIFFDLSKTVKPMILYLKERGIERIEFLRGMENEELSNFISFLTLPKEAIKIDPGDYLLNSGVKNIIVGKIKTSVGQSTGETKKPADYLGRYDESLDKVAGTLSNMLDAKDFDHLGLRLTMVSVMENLLGHYQDFLTFATIKRYDLRTFMHILNVAILSMYFSSRIGFSREETLEMGIAGLFHDIGKLYISRQIIQKPARLTEEEFAKIKSHATSGAQILLKYVDSLGVLPVIVCFEHHLKYDLSGYPKLTFYQKPHIASLIVSICDVYDALSQRRGYKRDYPPEMIYDLMNREKGSTFEPALLEKFFKIMGVWPVGSIVLLKDSRIAVVREENEDDIFSPTVEIIVPSGNKETINLMDLKDKTEIDRSLNPLGEGKSYLHLIQ